MTKLTKAEQARVDQIKGTKGPVPYKGDLLKAVCPDVEEAELARIGHARVRNWRRLVRVKAASAMSRVGMYVSRSEVEHG